MNSKVEKRNPILVLLGLVAIPLQYAFWGTLLTIRKIFSLPRGIEDWSVKSCAQFIAWCLQIRVRVLNREIYNDREAAIVIANHSSYIDIPVIQIACTDRLRMLAKWELFFVPFLGWAMWAANYVGVKRGKRDSASKATQALSSRLKNGYQIFLAPEGTRSPTGCLLPFKSGAFRIAATHKVPIYVLALFEPWKIFPKSMYIPSFKGEVEAKFLGKISPFNDEKGVKKPEELMSEARELFLKAGLRECEDSVKT